tara:strand:+ start:59 stop:670 length:612 start_codon:yes stop_codon:yes gene_type:complete
MYKLLCISFLLILIAGTNSYSQEFEIGPMFNLEHTSFNIPDDSFIVIGGPGTGGKGSRTTGFENNFSGGIYGSYFFSEQLALSAELFYTKTSATEFGDKSFSSINLIPYLSYKFFEEVPLFLNLGGGIAYMVKTPDFGDAYSIEENEIKKIDIPLKFSVSYNVKDFILIDLGIHSSVTSVVEDKILRTAYFVGVKMPLNKLLN